MPRNGAKQAAVSARKPRACHASHWSQASSRQSSKLCIAMVEATFRFMQAAAKTAPRRVLGISSNLSSRERRAREKNMRRTGRQGDTTDGGGKGLSQDGPCRRALSLIGVQEATTDSITSLCVRGLSKRGFRRYTHNLRSQRLTT